MTLPSLTVVTPWLNHREFERDYWQAIRAADDVRVLVIDNGSEPPLPNAVRLGWNTGFSHACNVGLELARTDAVVFLNNDVLVDLPRWDIPIREALDWDVLVGANLRYDQHGTVDGEQLPYLDGWCLAGMTVDLRELGGFNEDLDEPAYYSDNLICLEARAAGMTLREVKIGLRHKRNGTAGVADAHIRAVTDRNYLRFRRRAMELLDLEAVAA